MAAAGAAALATTVHFDLERLWQEEAAEQKALYLEWKEKDEEFRKIEKQWREIECKRYYADEKSKQLSMLAELGAWIGGFQMMMLYEQELPSLHDHTYSHALLLVWGISCMGVSCVMIYIMVVASIINFEVVEASGKEELEKDYNLDDQYHNDTDNIHGWKDDGLIVNAKQFDELWQSRYDRSFRNMVVAFSYCMPCFFANLALTSYVKFYLSTSPAFVCFVLAAVGSAYWVRVHSAMISHLVWRRAG